MSEWLKQEWFKVVCVFLLVAVLALGWTEWKEYKAKPAYVPPKVTTEVKPQVINTHTETVREVAVQTAPKGNIMQFTERDGKQFIIVEGKEYQLATQTGKPNVKIGENGQIVMSTETVAKLDVTDMVRAQVNDKLAIQGAEMKKEHDKEVKTIKAKNNVDKVLLTIGAAGVGYAAGSLFKK